MEIVFLDFTLLPSFTVMGPGFRLPLALMSALIEEPFYQLAGVRRHSIRWALRTHAFAYLWSWTLLPMLCLFSGGPKESRFALAGVATLSSSAMLYLKYSYLRRHTRVEKAGLKWIAIGHLVSLLVAVAIYFSLPLIRSARPDWARQAAPWQQIIYFVSVFPPLTVFGLATLSPHGERAAASGIDSNPPPAS